MNPVTIQRIFNQSESTGKYRYGGKKPINGDMRRRCEEDDLKKSNNVRRKQTKVRYDTWRRAEMPNEKDEKLENIHYSNFLGDKYGDNNAPYNSEYPVSLRYCDKMREEEEQLNDFDDSSHARKIKRMNAVSDSDSECDCVSLDSLSLGDEETPTELLNEDVSIVWDNLRRSSGIQRSNAFDWTETESKYYDYDEELEEEEELYQAKMNRFYAQEYAREVANFEEMVEYCVNMYCAITKRAREQYHDSEEPKAKRARCDDESNNV